MDERKLSPVYSIAALEAPARLLTIAQRDTGQSSRVAAFLLAWHNAEENGGWNPVDLWQLDDAICVDVLLVLRLIAQERKYPDDLGFGLEITKVWDGGTNPEAHRQGSACNEETRNKRGEH